MVQQDSTFLSPPDVAKRLKVDNAKVLRWIWSGELQAFNLSAGSERPRWKIAPSDYEAFLAKRSSRTQLVGGA